MGGPVVWRLSDGKPGHDSQSRGLIEALGRETPIECCEVCVADRGGLHPWSSMRRFYRHEQALPHPSLVVGAGHATHLPLLCARLWRRARAVVLMKPSLPLAWFDLCVVPAHDDPPLRDNVIVTQGVLNAVRASRRGQPAIGLILVGGPSAHYSWDGSALVQRIRTIIAADPLIAWQIADSRRTPAGTRLLLSEISAPSCTLVRHEETAREWLPGALAEAGWVWVTEDSVSMLYEALTAGAATGVLPVPRLQTDRLTKGVDALLASGRATAFERWAAGTALTYPARPLAEAERCARALLARWPELDSR